MLRVTSAVALALAVVGIVPTTVFAAVPEHCMWQTHAYSEHALTATDSETCGECRPSFLDLCCF
jgi:hypothetical protein